MNRTECFALLDDASAADPAHARSRLYTGHVGTLRCDDVAEWPAMLGAMQAALAQGQFAVSLLTYELGAHLLGIDAHAVDTPLAQVLLFERCEHLSPDGVKAWLGTGGTAGIAQVEANVDQAEFTRALNRIHDYIAAGDTYQVNYTYRLRFDAFGALPALYARLRARQPVPYGALVALPDGSAVLSLSPELFVRHVQGELLARPMKGTAPASVVDDENQARAATLAADPKNRAENLMIVDLLRNDLGRVAATGTVAVPALFDVQRYSSVLQMTSTVTAKLRGDATLETIFRALYPCGSITGAPKRRTMEIIRELEPAARGIYTGAIGWFDPPAGTQRIGDFCLSVPIRTLALQAPANGVRRGEMGVGAGIVFDSEPDDEFAECQLKARFLTGLANEFEIFETLRATRDGCTHMTLHLARMATSAQYFGFHFDSSLAQLTLDAACEKLPAGVHRMRLALHADGRFSTQASPITPHDEPVGVLLAPDATRSDDLFLRHKTSIRERYDIAWRNAHDKGAFDTLFFNERGELTEGGRTNVFVKVNGKWLTPPLSCGVLPGVMRSVLLSMAEEAVITRDMLLAADEVMICNALRGAMKARVT